MFTRLFARASHTLPSQCAVCRLWGLARVCSDCCQRFVPLVQRCLGCAEQLVLASVPDHAKCGACSTNPLDLDACFAAVDYAYPWDDVVSRLKLGNAQPALAGIAADVMVQNAALVQALCAADVVLPLPLSAARLRQRGFNQALYIARALSHTRIWKTQALGRNLPIDTRLLLRLHDRSPQMHLPRAQRLLNVQGVFAVEPLRMGLLQGKKVVLVDDVSTTGATLAAAAKVLRQAGAAQISAVVFAKTPVH